MAKPVDPKRAEKGRALAEYRAQYPEAFGFEVEWDDEVGVFVPTTRREATTHCFGTMKHGEACPRYAGAGTSHPGVGACSWHDSRVERAAGAWAVAHKIAQVMDVSPWDALLMAVKRCAAWASFYESKLAEVEHDDQLRPGGDAYHWVEAAERVNEKLARWSKMAVDAGVAKLMVERAQVEGATVARVLNAALAEVGLGEEVERQLRSALRRALLAEDPSAIETTSPDEVEGEEAD